MLQLADEHDGTSLIEVTVKLHSRTVFYYIMMKITYNVYLPQLILDIDRCMHVLIVFDV